MIEPSTCSEPILPNDTTKLFCNALDAIRQHGIECRDCATYIKWGDGDICETGKQIIKLKMSIQRQMEREEKCIREDYKRGLITREEYNNQLRDLEREYREFAKQSAKEAYDRELDNW